jgi:threonylcarbamoyladenosine tRNA methylthiotransferase MtaB
VCGCASEKDKQSFEEKGVAYVTGAQKKQQVVDKFCEVYGGKISSLPAPKQVKCRAFIKIQDGCNNFCSYCIIPYLRGREKSRSIEDICGEIAKTRSAEIVLNGINISSFNDNGKTLTDLILALQKEDARIRLGSLECSIISEKLLSALKGLKDFAPQFHLSLQSGSSKVLKSMNRHYTREEYIEKCKMIYSYFPDAAITCDIIAGFATETEQDYEESLSIIDEVGFARVHAFAYSPREGTNAYKLKDLPPDVKSERLHRLIQKGTESEQNYIKSFLGSTLSFIAEECKEGFTCGYSGNYIRIYVKGELEAGKKYDVILKDLYSDGAIAQIYGRE